MTAAHLVAPTHSRRRRAAHRRRQPYGVSEPGTYSTIPAWWSRERWRSECYADLHTEDVRQLRAQVGTRGPVSIRACWALAHALSDCADSATGRNALPGNAALTAKPDQLDLDDPAAVAKLKAATGYGKTTLQKASRVLAARGWIVLIRAGKNWLTIDERKELYRASSSARQRRNVWACTIPTRLRGDDPQRAAEPAPAPRPPKAPASGELATVDNSAAENPDAESGCDLPTTRRVSGLSPVEKQKIFKPEQPSTNAPPGRTPTKEARRNRIYRADWRSIRLAKDLQARINWLANVPMYRLTPPLDRFAKAGWTATDVQRELDALLVAWGWEVPSGKVTTTKAGRVHRYQLECPWGYLAKLLRGLEPTDLIARREHERAQRQGQLDFEELLRTGPECRHGQPGGDVPSPGKGIRACPLCRRGAP